MKKTLILLVLSFIIIIEIYGIIKYDNKIKDNNIIIKSINKYLSENSWDFNNKIENIKNNYLLLEEYKTNKQKLSIFEKKIFIEKIIWDITTNIIIKDNTIFIYYEAVNISNIIDVKDNINLFEKKQYYTILNNDWWKINNQLNKYNIELKLELSNKSDNLIRNYLKQYIKQDKRLENFYKILE